MRFNGFCPAHICFDPISITALAIAGAVGAGATAGIVGSQQKSMAKKQAAAVQAANDKAAAATAATPQVDDTAPDNTKASRIGRAALISTSPLGVQTTDPTGRRKLLGNV